MTPKPGPADNTRAHALRFPGERHRGSSEALVAGAPRLSGGVPLWNWVRKLGLCLGRSRAQPTGKLRRGKKGGGVPDLLVLLQPSILAPQFKQRKDWRNLGRLKRVS